MVAEKDPLEGRERRQSHSVLAGRIFEGGYAADHLFRIRVIQRLFPIVHIRRDRVESEPFVRDREAFSEHTLHPALVIRDAIVEDAREQYVVEPLGDRRFLDVARLEAHSWMFL